MGLEWKRPRARAACLSPAACAGCVMPLTMAPTGQLLRLCRLHTGRRASRRLAELGLTPGVALRVVQDAGGPLLLSVRDSRIALGRGLADQLSVEVVGAA